MSRATQPQVIRPDIPVPTGHWWAVHAIWEIPSLVAATLDLLDAMLTEADRARLDEASTLVREKHPQWRVGLLTSRRRWPRPLRHHHAQLGQFYAYRRWPWTRWHPATGWTAGDLLDDIASIIRDRAR